MTSIVEMETVDYIYYINLDHRIDRRKEIENELKIFHFPPEKLIRVPAIYTERFGALGCGMSHCKALTLFLQSNAKNCIIFEDDFMFTQPIHIIQDSFQKASQIPFDIIMLASNTLAEKNTEWSFLTKIYSAQTTSGYWITREFAVTLLSCFEKAVQLLKNRGEVNMNAIDQVWKDYQRKARWYCFSPKLGCQRESYSDIEKKVTNYNV